MVQKMNPLLKRIYWHVGPVIAACSVLGAVYLIDTQMFPPLRSFTVLKASISGDHLVIKGVMDKARCSISQDPKAYDQNGNQLDIDFLDRRSNTSTTTRASIIQDWGPWIVNKGALAESVGIYSIHTCHFMWDRETHLAQINILKLKLAP